MSTARSRHQSRPLVRDPATVAMLLPVPRVLLHRPILAIRSFAPETGVLIGVAEEPAIECDEPLLREQRRPTVRAARDEMHLALLAGLQRPERGIRVFGRHEPVRGEQVRRHASSAEAERSGHARTRLGPGGNVCRRLAEAGAARATNAHQSGLLGVVTSRCSAILALHRSCVQRALEAPTAWRPARAESSVTAADPGGSAPGV